MGYGDIVPRTDIGKFIMFLCSMIGICIISLMVVAVKNKLDMSGLETKAYTVINRVTIKAKVKDAAAEIINRSAKIFLRVRKHKDIKSRHIFDLQKSVSRFKKLRT